MKKYILFLLLCSAFLYAETNDWVLRITDDKSNIVELSVSDIKGEISNYATTLGTTYENIKPMFTNEITLWQFVSEIVDLEVLYIKAKQEGFDKKTNTVALKTRELDRQIAQLYAPKVLNSALLEVSDQEKKDFWTKNQARIRMVNGNVQYKDIEMQIEATLIQEKMKKEYDRFLKEADTKYKLKYSDKEDPCVVIEDVSVPKAEFDAMFEEALKNTGNVTSAMLSQAKVDMFKTFVVQQIIVYEAKKNGFEKSEEVKFIERYIDRTVAVNTYIDEVIVPQIEASEKSEIDEAYKRYGATYKIDSMSYADAQNTLDKLVKSTKLQNKQRLTTMDLRYRYKIEKNIDILKNNL